MSYTELLIRLAVFVVNLRLEEMSWIQNRKKYLLEQSSFVGYDGTYTSWEQALLVSLDTSVTTESQNV